MLSQLRPAIVSTLFFTLLLGVGYPLAITGIAQVAMPPGRGKPDQGCLRPGHRLGPDRPTLRQGRVSSRTTVGRRQRL